MDNIKKNKIIIIGGGLAGMLTAYLAAKKYKQAKVILIEKNKKLGGLYNSINFSKKYTFDIGMHLIYACKNKILNNILLKKIYNKWNIFRYPKKDIAGVYYNNNLNFDSPYIDLTRLPKKKFIEIRKNIEKLSKKKIKKISDYKNLAELYKDRFGKKTFKNIINPILKKLWGVNATKMDPLASILVLIDRVILFKDNKNLNRILNNDGLRKRIGYPFQLKLPKKYYSKQNFGLYPKKFGLYNVINYFEKQLKKLNIEIFKNTRIEKFFFEKNYLSKVQINSNSVSIDINNVKKVYWSSPSFELKKLLDLKIKFSKIDSRKQVLVYLLLKEKPNMKNLYYFYCFQKKFHTYRVTNYYNYCPASKKLNNYFPVCVELHFKKNYKKNNFIELATNELLDMKIIKKRSEVFKSFYSANSAFPLLTLSNIKILKNLRDGINKKNIKNFFLCNQAPEKKIFFMHDVLDQNYKLLSNKS